MVNDLIIGLIGAISGLHSACWGLYKDSPYERGNLSKFVRSILMGIVIAFLFNYLLLRANIINVNLGIFFAVCVLFERFITEIYKGFFREESQKNTKYHPYFT